MELELVACFHGKNQNGLWDKLSGEEAATWPVSFPQNSLLDIWSMSEYVHLQEPDEMTN